MGDRDHPGRLLLLVPTTSYRISDFLEAAQGLGVDVVVGSNERQVLDIFADDAAVFVDLGRPDNAVQQIIDYHGRHPLAAILATDDETIVLAARASLALGLPHNPPEAVQTARNKFRFRTRLANTGLPSPRFSLIARQDDPGTAAGTAVYPCVLKPLALSAGRGVIRADDPQAFIAAFHRITGILDRPDALVDGTDTEHILVEDYIPGREVALEGLVQNGHLRVLALFDKPDPMEGPYFEETIYTTPSRLAGPIQEAAIAATTEAIAALGLHDGPVHAELRVNDRGVWMIEVAARSIGGLCARVLRFGVGITLEDLILRHALRLPIDSCERERQAAGVMMIPIPRAGTLRGINGLDAARALPGIEEVTISIPVGQEVVPPPDGYRYLGFIFAKGDDPGIVEAILRQAHGHLIFTIEPSGPP
jgi:biotin carboxylase